MVLSIAQGQLYFALLYFKGKGKVICALNEHHTMKAYWGSVGIVPHML
jgi:hypothetical protein